MACICCRVYSEEAKSTMAIRCGPRQLFYILRHNTASLMRFDLLIWWMMIVISFPVLMKKHNMVTSTGMYKNLFYLIIDRNSNFQTLIRFSLVVINANLTNVDIFFLCCGLAFAKWQKTEAEYQYFLCNCSYILHQLAIFLKKQQRDLLVSESSCHLHTCLSHTPETSCSLFQC